MTYTARIERIIPAPRARVWRAFTTAELAEWYWPPSFGTTVDIDLRVGGTFRVQSGDGTMAISGVFVAVDAPDRIVQTWRWDGDERETLVTITFDDAPDDGTALTIVHENFADESDCANHQQGWNDCLDRLPGQLANYAS